MRKKIVFALALLSFVACGKKDSDKKSEDGSRTLVSKPDLTDSQTEEIKGITAKINLMPKTRLLVEDFQKGSSAKTQQEEEIKKMKAETKQIFDKVNADCQVVKLERKSNGALKEKGSKMEIKGTASIGGEKCPLDLKKTVGDEHVLIEKSEENEDAQKFKQSTEITSKESEVLKIKVEDLQKQLGLKELTTEISSSQKITIAGKNFSFSHRGSRTSQVMTVRDQKVKIDETFEGIKTGDQMEDYFRYDFEFPSSSPTIQIFSQAGNSLKYYLNGKEITAEKVTEIFNLSVTESESVSETVSEIKRKISAQNNRL